MVKALKREVREETGLRVQVGSLLGVLDRRDKNAITLLFAAYRLTGLTSLSRSKRRLRK
jgi:ADP-ribose pyrophosphatase YjhB (NUDIX family)